MLRILTISALLAVLPAAAAQAEEALPVHQKSASATQSYPSPAGGAVVWVDPSLRNWVNQPPENVTVFLFKNLLAEGRLITTSEGKDVETQLAETLERLEKSGADTHVQFREKRLVNGAEVLCVQIVTVRDGNDILYYGYLYGDDAKTAQFFAVTQRTRAPRLYTQMTELLDGLVIDGSSPSEKTPQ